MSALLAILFWIMVAVAAFHAAYASSYTSPLILLYLFALLRLAQTDQWRKAFYSGLAVGLLIAVVRLQFFWPLFSGGALALWVVYAFWIGFYVAFARLSLMRLGPRWGWLLIPFLWTGLEYFRSEVYYLRFSWLSAGYAFAGAPWQGALKPLGTYGIGFLLVSLASVAAQLWQSSRIRAVTVLLVGAGGICLTGFLSGRESPSRAVSHVRVAGIQMEFPTEKEVLFRLNDAIRAHPDAELVVLSEYTFEGPVPTAIKAWCRKSGRYLVVGGKDPVSGATAVQPTDLRAKGLLSPALSSSGGEGNAAKAFGSSPNSAAVVSGARFYNTAYVVGPEGRIVFRQAKAVPIQFFKDGLPAPEQTLWDSPWGQIGICICYDLSYTRVTDRLIQLGAEALIVPTMDVADWGRAQHQLHARIAPIRATEYGLPIFRLASSGISQLVDRAGRVTATAPCPGDGAILAGTLELRGSGRRPLDRWLAPFATAVTAVAIVWFSIIARPQPRKTPQPRPRIP